MKIKPFRIQVNPQQSRIVQETLFKNGYNWWSLGSPCEKIVQLTNESVLHFDGHSLTFGDLLTFNSNEDYGEEKINFSKFENLYTLKGVRKNKLLNIFK